jgi:quercetin dioxygenase-like cupin family protein
MLEIYHDNFLRIRDYSLDKKQKVEEHFHTKVTDLIDCTKGNIIVTTQNKTYHLYQGNYCIIDPQQIHSVLGSEQQESHYLLIQYGGEYDFIKQST